MRLFLPLALLAFAAAGAPPPASRNDDEFTAAMRRAFAEPYHLAHQRLVLAQLDGLTTAHAPRVYALFDDFKRDGVKLDFAWKSFWTRWGEVDGAAALAFATAHRPDASAFPDIVSGWAAIDPPAAERWLRAQREHPQFGDMFSPMVEGWARRSLEEATRAAFTAPPPREKLDAALGALAQTALLAGGVPRVIAWFESLNDSAKPLAMQHAAWRIRHGEPALAAPWFGAQAAQPWRDDGNLRGFLERYIDRDPAAAMNWAITLPPPPDSTAPAGLSSGVERWTQRDPLAAAAWLKTHDKEPWWSRAAAGHVRALRKRTPAAAQQFLDSLPAERRAALESELQKK